MENMRGRWKGGERERKLFDYNNEKLLCRKKMATMKLNFRERNSKWKKTIVNGKKMKSETNNWENIFERERIFDFY